MPGSREPGGCQDRRVNSAQPGDRGPENRLPTQPAAGVDPLTPADQPATGDRAGRGERPGRGREVGPATSPDELDPERVTGAPSRPGPSAAHPIDPEADDPEEAVRLDEQVVPAAIRAQRSTKDIVISLLVLLIPIALLIGFGRLFLNADQPTQVDAGPAINQARAANAFPVSEPAGLGEDWRTVHAEFQRTEAGATLRLGYLTPADGGVQVVQSNIPAEQLLPVELSAQGRPQGLTELGGRSWQRYTARRGELALVLLEPGRTIIVVGSVPENDLRRLANALR